ncbi:MAG: hypothetical protein MUO68_03980 [Desulfobacteraceae bacterium]|jgi:hypothetical protein|nr:hypothetical protein [Desulfobacteraceae bacterium]
MEKTRPKESSLLTWLVIWLLALAILLQGHFVFKAVGDFGQPTWDYGTIKDVPGQSPYAMYQLLPNPQHIRGKTGK